MDLDSYVAGLMAAQQLGSIQNTADHTWIYEAMGGGKSQGGQTVNYRTSMTLAWVSAAQQIISGDTASLPFETKRLEADGDCIADNSTPAYAVMNGDANRNMTAFSFRETITHHALMQGNGMAFIFRNPRTQAVEELVPAERGALKPMLNSSGVLVYHDDKHNETYSQWDILHIRGLSDDGISGLSWIDLAKESVGLGLAENKHGAKHFAKGARPSLVLEHPRKLNKEDADEFLQRFEERHQDEERPALAHGGLKISHFPINNTDAQWLESRQFTREEIAAWFQLPSYKIGGPPPPYNGWLALSLDYLTNTLRRWLKRWETEVHRKLIRQSERPSVKCVHDPRPLIDTDTSEITDQVVKQTSGMLITVNEGRARLGYPKIEGGDVLLNPNTTSGGTLPGEESTEEQRAAVVDALADRLTTYRNALKAQTERKAAKGETIDREAWAAKLAEYVNPTLCIAQSIGLKVVNSAPTTQESLHTEPRQLAEKMIGI